jgi:TonB family protein
MMLWMVYSLLVGLLLTFAAHGAERVLRLHGRATRYVWLSALLLSLGLPALIPWVTRLLASDGAGLLVPSSATISLASPLVVSNAGPAFSWSLALQIGWISASALLVVYGVLSLWRLARSRRGWRPDTVLEQDVLISDEVGPAVVGLIDPAIVLPKWVRTLSYSEQALIIAHERAHIEAKDPWLVRLSQVAPVLMPWNVPLWLQSKRLRECVELDCDARLLATGEDADGYAELLLHVGERVTRVVFAAAMAEPRSLLEKRIMRLFERRPRRTALLTSVWGAVALVAFFAAFNAPLPAKTSQGQEQQQQEWTPTFTPFTVPPELLNAREVSAALQRFYPPLLRSADVGGTVKLWFYIDREGNVAKVLLKSGSGHAALDDAALKVAEVMQFSPAKNRDQIVAVWVDMPIVFRTKEPQKDTLTEVRAKAFKTSQAPASAPVTVPAGVPKPDEVSATRRVSPSTIRDRRAAETVISERKLLPTEKARADTIVVLPTIREVPDAGAPVLLNGPAVAQALQRYYPPLLRDAGIGGEVLIWFYVDEEGKVAKAQVKKSSGEGPLDDAALKVAELMQFAPARKDGQPVAAWIDIPISFRPK